MNNKKPRLWQTLMQEEEERKSRSQQNVQRLETELSQSMRKSAKDHQPPQVANTKQQEHDINLQFREQFSSLNVSMTSKRNKSSTFPEFNVESDSIEDDDSDDIPNYLSNDSDVEWLDEELPRSSQREMSQSELIMSVLMFQARHNLSNRAVQDLVKLINSVPNKKFEDGPRIPFSEWDTLIKKVPKPFVNNIQKYYYFDCGHLHGPCTSPDPNAICPNEHRQGEECSLTKDFFTYIPLKDWLLHQLAIHFKNLRIVRPGHNELKFFHDLPQCDAYQELIKSTDDIPVLTLTVGWDGASYTEDNNHSMWPLIAYLNELPYQTRIKNPMLLALQAGRGKPKSDIMFRPLVDELLYFEKNPLIMSIDGKVQQFYIKLFLIIADAPARAAILNMKSHNSINGRFCLYFCID